jgi:hypothetical protein
MLNFGGQQTVSTSVQNFVRMTLRKRSFVCGIPPRLQVLRPPIQPNHGLLNPGARTDPAGWHDLAQCWRRYEDRQRPPSALEAKGFPRAVLRIAFISECRVDPVQLAGLDCPLADVFDMPTAFAACPRA